MKKWINKNGKSLTIAFVLSAFQANRESSIAISYMMIHIAKENKNDNNDDPFITTTTETKNTKGWPSHSKEVPFYQHGWTPSNFFDKPYDWREQEDIYDKQVKNYRRVKSIL
jgi:hypothetical protein